jgi:pyridoxal phosphate enzyme (YggS family)
VDLAGDGGAPRSGVAEPPSGAAPDEAARWRARAAEIAAGVRAVRRRVVAAAARMGRDPESVRLVAVGKGHTGAEVALAVAAGIRDCGENRVQEALPKIAALGEVRWHLIGQLQRNKARAAAGRFSLIHSVDRRDLADALARAAENAGVVQDILVQVNLTGRPGQGGIAPAAAADLVAHLRALPALRLRGLMVIAPPATDPEAARPAFATLRVLRDRLREASGLELPELSMGMSDDFEIAVEEGATLVRVGRAIFGPRPPAAGE